MGLPDLVGDVSAPLFKTETTRSISVMFMPDNERHYRNLIVQNVELYEDILILDSDLKK